MARKGFDMQTAAIIGIVLAVVAGGVYFIAGGMLIDGLEGQSGEALTQLEDAEKAAKEAGRQAGTGTESGFSGTADFGCENA